MIPGLLLLLLAWLFCREGDELELLGRRLPIPRLAAVSVISIFVFMVYNLLLIDKVPPAGVTEPYQIRIIPPQLMFSE